MPEGLTASAGASGTSEIRSDIAALPNLGWYLVLPRNGSRNPNPQVAERKSPQPSRHRSAAVKAVVLVEAAIVVKGAAACIEVALLGIEPMLLVPIRPFTLILAPSIVRWGRRRFTIHGSADPLQDITRALRMRRHRAQHENQRKCQDRPLYHFTLPCAVNQKRVCAAVSNTAERASVPVAILVPLDDARGSAKGCRRPG